MEQIIDDPFLVQKERLIEQAKKINKDS